MFARIGAAPRPCRHEELEDTPVDARPRSPLGQALIGTIPGEQREYRTPDGVLLRVSLVEAVTNRSSTHTS